MYRRARPTAQFAQQWHQAHCRFLLDNVFLIPALPAFPPSCVASKYHDRHPRMPVDSPSTTPISGPRVSLTYVFLENPSPGRFEINTAGAGLLGLSGKLVHGLIRARFGDKGTSGKWDVGQAWEEMRRIMAESEVTCRILIPATGCKVRTRTSVNTCC